jgi:hypothetical protein|tara:strand:+ start:390 stop:623 length:234 start_codon:yes stop_codon:yes gene_type:complete
MRTIDYVKVIKNIQDMINLLEYDSMRSPGKTKMNAETLVSLYSLKDRYDDGNSKLKVEEPIKKTVTKPTAKTSTTNN